MAAHFVAFNIPAGAAPILRATFFLTAICGVTPPVFAHLRKVIGMNFYASGGGRHEHAFDEMDCV